jgi:hydroxyacylglutathione hydrolase
MKRLNAAGPPILDGFRRLPRLADDRLVGAIDAGAVVIDTRDPATFAGGHVPGTINIPLNNSFPTWAGWLVPYSSTAYLIVDESCANCLDEGMRDLSMIGLDAVRGYFGSAAVASWARSGRTLATVRHVTATELAPRVRDAGAQVIDVRGHAEWMGGHLAGARNIPLGYLSEHLGELAADVPLVVHCQGGARSAIAASVLAARGFSNVVTLAGGVVEWERSGFPLERSAEYGAAQPVACCTEGAATVVRS